MQNEYKLLSSLLFLLHLHLLVPPPDPPEHPLPVPLPPLRVEPGLLEGVLNVRTTALAKVLGKGGAEPLKLLKKLLIYYWGM